MIKLKIFFALILFVLTVPICVSAYEAKPENFGAVVDDGLDDSLAVQAAIDDVLTKGGGTIVFPGGKLNLNRTIRLVPDGYMGGEVKLQGNRGSVLEISMGTSGIAFYAGNLNSFTLEDLVFVGKPAEPGAADFYDANYVVFSNYVQQTNITRCQFYGLAVPSGSGLIYVGNTDARIADSQFDGSLGAYPNGAVIMADNPRGLTVSRCTFLDYANFRGQYLAKSPAYLGAWIWVKGTGANFNANGIRRVVIEDSRFDEASASAINIENVPWVNIRGISVNVNGADPGRGVYLKNVEYARIEESWFGYTTLSKPALDLVNVQGLEVAALKLTGGVYFWRKQNVSSTSIKFCPQCR